MVIKGCGNVYSTLPKLILNSNRTESSSSITLSSVAQSLLKFAQNAVASLSCSMGCFQNDTATVKEVVDNQIS